MKTKKELLGDMRNTRDALNEMATRSEPLLRSALRHLDEAIDDLEDKLASDERRDSEQRTSAWFQTKKRIRTARSRRSRIKGLSTN